MAVKQQDRNKAGEYVCPDCDRTFGTPQNLGRHRQAMHSASNNGQPQPQEDLSEGEELNSSNDGVVIALTERIGAIYQEMASLQIKREQLLREADWLANIKDMVEAGYEPPPA